MIKPHRVNGRLFRIHGYGNPARVWVGVNITPGPLTPTSIIQIKDSTGHTEQVLAGDPQLQSS